MLPQSKTLKEIWISKAIYGEEEKKAVMDVLNSGWLGIGKKSEEFEQLMKDYIGVKHAMFVNSGSSALLLGLKALNLPKYSEVITCAAGFPSTLSPILHSNLRPVLVDCELDTFNIDPKLVNMAVSKNTSGIVFAHAAGNPVNLKGLESVLKSYPSVEDACDSLAASYNDKMIGSYGTVSAFSFYASHHITGAGGGGMVLTDNEEIAIRLFSMRDWGKRYINSNYYQRNASCYDTLVDGVFYDRSYSYDTIGFNFKLIELGAAFAVEQMKRLDGFIKRRNANFKYLYEYFFKTKNYTNYFIPPRVYSSHNPSWFFFVFILRDNLKFTRKQFATYLEENGIRTRPFFAGNILRQPALKGINVKVVGSLKNANKLMEDAVMIGVHPDIGPEELKYITSYIDKFVKKYA